MGILLPSGLSVSTAGIRILEAALQILVRLFHFRGRFAIRHVHRLVALMRQFGGGSGSEGCCLRVVLIVVPVGVPWGALG